MMRMPEAIRRLRRDEEGATIIEFALIAGPMFLLLLGGLDLGYQSYIRSTMQGALNDAARIAAVESPSINASGSTLEQKVENLIKNTVKPIAPNATITVTQKSYFDFSKIGNPEKLMTDNNSNGEYDAADADCFEDANGNGTYDTDAGASGIGGADDVVLYTATISAPRLMPIHGFIPGLGDKINYTLETAVRNQPYDAQATAAVICG